MGLCGSNMYLVCVCRYMCVVWILVTLLDRRYRNATSYNLCCMFVCFSV